MAWLLVPLQYLFLIWRAQSLIAKAANAAGTRKHPSYLRKATNAVIAAEILQRRFPQVTNWIDIRRNEEALRFELRK
jgi:dsRNA-specific ribonuclease